MPAKKHTAMSQSVIITWGWFVLLTLLGGTAQVRDTHDVPLEIAAVLFLGYLAWQRPQQLAPRGIMLLGYVALVLVAIQMVPLPYSLWQALPGHALYASSLEAAGMPPIARPWTISPDLTLAALTGLLPLLVTIAALRGLNAEQRRNLSIPLLIVLVLGALLGMLQMAGGAESAWRLYRLGTVDGPTGFLSNRNHHALTLAMAIPLAATVIQPGLVRRGGAQIALIVALGCVLFFAMAVLIAGSRGSLAAAALGLVAAVLPLRATIAELPSVQRRWLVAGAIGTVAAITAVSVLILVQSDRALAIIRLWGTSAQEELRWRTVRPILDIAMAYFPLGTGYGTFDPAFRAAEPLSLLKPTYLNEAHNEPLQLLMEGGVAGVALMLAGIVGIVRAAVAACAAAGRVRAYALLGCVMLVQLAMVSLFDYPLRTPLLGSFAILAFFWLRDAAKSDGPNLPAGWAVAKPATIS